MTMAFVLENYAYFVVILLMVMGLWAMISTNLSMIL